MKIPQDGIPDQRQPTQWLLLVHQLPPDSPYLRVKVARRLLRIGAVAIKNTVYALPFLEPCREDFQWIAREIHSEGGEATVCEAVLLEGLSDADVEQRFRRARKVDYLQTANAARTLLEALHSGQPSTEFNAQARRELAALRRRQEQTVSLDFFSAPGRGEADALLLALNSHLNPGPTQSEERPGEAREKESYRGRTWVTRGGLHLDRIASAWLIRRFIDPDAHFKFVPSRGYLPAPREVRFDMFEAEFTHEGDACTFEVLLKRMALWEPALVAIGEIIHDLDLKDGKFNRLETFGLRLLFEGMAFAHADDETRLERGGALLDDLYALYIHTEPSTPKA